jgi:hypothetical protein
MKRFAQSILVLLLALLAPAVIATAQAPDSIIIDGKSESLNTNPLRAFLRDNPNLLPESDFESTGNWRGYVATWEVADDSLLLTRIDVDFKDPKASADSHTAITRNVFDKLFPGAERVVATWYSGALIIPRGEIVNYVHMGYGSTYERYTILVVKSGLVTKRLDLSAKEFEAYRASQFNKFKSTPEYKALLNDTMSRDSYYTSKRAEEFLYQFESESYLSADYGPAP